MHFVTLTSDWNKNDYYTGAIKGKIYNSCENVKVVSISNTVKPFHVAEAAFIIRNSYAHFPPGSVHIIAVNSRPEPETKFLAAEINGHFFITSDNGILGLLGESDTTNVVQLEFPENNISSSFPALGIFCSAACSIIKGKELKALGKPFTDFRQQIPLRATLENNTITGTVIYIDSYGNAITNISRELFNRFGKKRPFKIFVQSKHYVVSRINQLYSETDAGDLLAMFNSVNLLEIAIRNGSASNLLNLNTDSTIRVEFTEKNNENKERKA
ncbi:MAG: SAM-dependent chlorinase/fluorinase [Bacteroidales bacterium]|nr:SAM-dependent chlorinase/fluorinase [Bacteroidales bacterium]